MRCKKYILYSLLISTLAGCGGSDDSDKPPENTPIQPKTTVEIINNLEKEGKLPVLDRTNSLIGVDSNSNGIRDDIDNYISKSSYTSDQKKALEQVSKGFQSSLTVNTTDMQAVKKVSKDIGKGIDCVFTKVGVDSADKSAGKVVQELESLTTNTKARLLAYLKYNNALDGTSSALTEGDSCE